MPLTQQQQAMVDRRALLDRAGAAVLAVMQEMNPRHEAGQNWGSVGSMSREFVYRKIARAVIAAMREPTEAMKETAVEHANLGGEVMLDQIGDVWRAMIDEAAKV
jgi:hypothetical protein